MGREIEIKLLLDPAHARRFMAHPLLRTATARSDHMLDNTYFDTPDLGLRRRGVALRVRRIGRRRLQTIKLAAKAVAGSGLSMRPEWETPFAGSFDFSMIDVPRLRAWLQRDAIASAIGPLFTTRFRRLTWHLALPAGGEVLVALDRGDIVAAGRSAPICEVELELSSSDDVAALRNLAVALGERVPLMPSDVSKAQRGYALLATRR